MSLQSAIERRLGVLPKRKSTHGAQFDVVTWAVSYISGNYVRLTPIYRCGFDGAGVSCRVSGDDNDAIADGIIADAMRQLA